jgi:tubulin monoglycylase TTLL15
VELAQALRDVPYHPQSFVLPKESDKFEETLKEDPNSLWVVKSSTHRRIKIYKGKDVPHDLSGSFVQEFISNPFLIGGRKFDIGLYTVIAGVDPLRVYVYEEEFLLRFCAKDYRPLNISNIDQYVVTDNYSPVWETPIIGEKYAKHMLSAKESFLTYMKDHGYGTEVKRIMQEMKEIIRSVLQHFEPSLVNAIKKYGDPKHFFELVRFDFIIDESLKVWLMEINMSPNLDPSHFPPNVVMYEQVFFSTLSLIGLIRAGGYTYNGEFESIMLVRERDLHLPLVECYNRECTGCKLSICSLCSQCITPKEEYILKQAFLEHLGRRNFARVIPPPIEEPSKLTGVEDSRDEQLTPTNRLLTRWFRGKCLQHVGWCS